MFASLPSSALLAIIAAGNECLRLTRGIGFPMATNLRAKIPADDTLLVHDRNGEATRMFAQEMQGRGAVEVVESSRELAERSVSFPLSLVSCRLHESITA